MSKEQPNATGAQIGHASLVSIIFHLPDQKACRLFTFNENMFSNNPSLGDTPQALKKNN